jgi:hypothetical protein
MINTQPNSNLAGYATNQLSLKLSMAVSQPNEERIPHAGSPLKPKVRGLRGNHYGGSHDDQIEFEFDSNGRDHHAKQLRGVARDRLRSCIVRDNKFKLRGCKGDFSKLRGNARRDAMVNDARRRRLVSQTEVHDTQFKGFVAEFKKLSVKSELPWARRKRSSNAPSVPTQVSSFSAQFKRTGALPVITIAEFDSLPLGSCSRRLADQIRIQLIRAGIEEDPGPPKKNTLNQQGNTVAQSAKHLKVIRRSTVNYKTQLALAARVKCYPNKPVEDVDNSHPDALVCNVCHQPVIYYDQLCYHATDVMFQYPELTKSLADIGGMGFQHTDAAVQIVFSPSKEATRELDEAGTSAQHAASAMEPTAPVEVTAPTQSPVVVAPPEVDTDAPRRGGAELNPGEPDIMPVKRIYCATIKLIVQFYNWLCTIAHWVYGDVTNPGPLLSGYLLSRAECAFLMRTFTWNVRHSVVMRHEPVDKRLIINRKVQIVDEPFYVCCVKTYIAPVDIRFCVIVTLRILTYVYWDIISSWGLHVLTGIDQFISPIDVGRWQIVVIILRQCISITVASLTSQWLHYICTGINVVTTTRTWLNLRDRSTIFYIPHIVSCLLSEYEADVTRSIAEKTIASRSRRLASFPVPDHLHIKVIGGSELVVLSLIERRNCGVDFRFGQGYALD